ncbi:hypothetical protein [Nocardia sp. NBC_01388]
MSTADRDSPPGAAVSTGVARQLSGYRGLAVFRRTRYGSTLRGWEEIR